MVNKEFIIAGIKNLLKRNYHIDPDTVDVEAHVDNTLTYGENWNMIKEMVRAHNIGYEYLHCKKCNFQIKDNWNYCPICSRDLRK